ncbi:MAG: cyclomaltodextrinase N-terminal domain-containing protein [Flavobacteriales bacterium]|nr:cyclomaltodextrinase N-terminal domain-containing protein [Flavobacteriales bacterium]
MKKYLKIVILVITLAGLCQEAFTQVSTINRIDPPHWFVGLEDPIVELLVSGQKLQGSTLTVDGNCEIVSVETAPNPDYLYVHLKCPRNMKEGEITLHFKDAVGEKLMPYRFVRASHSPLPHSQSDLMYLIMPDRFCNHNPANDSAEDMKERADRQNIKGRHGGDIAGVTKHLDYLKTLGVTSVWLNPTLENDEPKTSYHGYAITDHYRVDPRLGTLEEYIAFGNACHQRDMKVVMDVIYNHWGDRHYLYRNLPDSGWINFHTSFTQTNYRAETLMDPYASEGDKRKMTDGWFDTHMPDLNQRNPHLANYLIQQTIWWIETVGIDALRIDTYAYPDQHFMEQLCQRMNTEFPDMLIFGETWVQGTPIQSWFADRSEPHKLGISHTGPRISLTDFQLYYAITEGLNEPFGWTDGLTRIELTLAHDYLYQDPSHLVTFLDNHDLSRVYSLLHEDFQKWKMAVTILLTTRGIPCIYYGTEILMKNHADPDALVREEFPGGWPDHAVNKFESNQRNAMENEAFDLIRKLQQWKAAHAWMASADLTQFVPRDGVYMYVRSPKNQENTSDFRTGLLVIVNQQQERKAIEWDRLTECFGAGTALTNVISGERIIAGESTFVPASGCLVLTWQ